ncbi:MAG: tyrosine-type recombinase/integrase [Thermoleophilia bacterium]
MAPTGRPGHNRGQRLPVELLSEGDMRALMAALSCRSSSGLRSRALIAVMWRAGLRVSEALALLPRHVDLGAGAIVVVRGKGGRSRTVGIDPGGAGIVGAWLERRMSLGPGRSAPLFCTLDGRGGVSAQQTRAMLARAAASAGIAKRVHPHALRHRCAWELAVEEGMPVTVVQAQLGHASLATTHRYLNHIAPADLLARSRNRQMPTLPPG